jgi:hypothetical protein
MAKLGSMGSKQAVTAFEEDFVDVHDDLYAAVEEDPGEKKRAAVIAAGEKKLAEYARLLERIDDKHKADLERDFGAQIEAVRARIAELSER